jgi:hypothetical protein
MEQALPPAPGSSETIEVGENTTGKVNDPTAPPEGIVVPAAPGAPAVPGAPATPAAPASEFDRRYQELPAMPGAQPPVEGVEDPGKPDFRPDFKYETEQGRHWKGVSDQRRGLGIEVNEQGRYRVEYGDSLSAIAERNLRSSGLATNKQSVEAEVAQIVSLNQNRYPSLSVNNHYIKTGWTLTIPRHQPGEAPPAPAQPAPPVVEAPLPPPRPQPPRVEVIPPPGDVRQPAVNRGGVYINEAGTVNVYQGGQREVAPPVVQNFPRQQQIEPYYEPQVMVQPPRQRSVVVIDRGDDYGYQEPIYRDRMPRYPQPQVWQQDGGCFGQDRWGVQDRWGNDRWGNQDRWGQDRWRDARCRTNPRFAVDFSMNQGRRFPHGGPFRPPYQNYHNYGNQNIINFASRGRGSSIGISIGF